MKHLKSYTKFLPSNLRVIISVYFGKVEKLRNHFHKILNIDQVPEINILLLLQLPSI